MAQQAMQIIVGVDVCKDRLEIFEQCGERAYSIDNEAAAIAAWLEGMQGRLKLALEPTNRYHLELAEAAHARGPIRRTRGCWHGSWRGKRVSCEHGRR